MKKILSLLLALAFAAIAVCSLSVAAFADPADNTADTSDTSDATEASTEEETLPGNRPGQTEAPETEPSTEAESTEAASDESGEASTEAKEEESTLASDEPLTNPEGVTAIPEDDTTTTKAPAPVVSVIPDTGSGIVVPAVALLALAAGTVAVIKTKKD